MSAAFQQIYKGRDFWVPAFDVKIRAKELPSVSNKDIVAVRYSDSIDQIDSFELTVNNWDADKRDFMDGFESTLPKTLSAHKALVDKEHAWLQSSLNLYQYALSRQGAYVYQDRNLLFKKTADTAAFNQKLVKAHTLKAEFLKSYWDARRAQKAVIVQMGLQGTELGPMPPQ